MFTQKLRTKKPHVPTQIRILPQQPSKSRRIEGSGVVGSSTAIAKPYNFFEAYGPIGVLLFIAASVSVCWTVWLILLNVAPNDTANYLMDTGDFDDGHFWLIIAPEPTLTTFNAITLAALVLSYVHILLKMTLWRNSRFRITSVGPTNQQVPQTWISILPCVGKYVQLANTFWAELTGYYGHYRKFWVRRATRSLELISLLLTLIIVLRTSSSRLATLSWSVSS